jgi:uncharacterized membrane protein
MVKRLFMEKVRLAFYWIATGLIVIETAVGAEWDLARIQFVKNIFDQLGYPYYLLTILGLWKIPAAIVLVIPRFGRVKEWAYFGLFLVYTGAAASHFMHGDTQNAWSPLVLTLITIASWWLRPPTRKWTPAPESLLAPRLAPRPARGRGITYWIFTGLLAFMIASGGIAQLLGARENVQGIQRLGYPAFFVTILGFWKLLGGIAILLPRLKRRTLDAALFLLQEWAYAGIVFTMTGAAVSNIVGGSPVWHPVVNMVLLAFTLISWVLRPAPAPAPVS